jgi:hypothetical protein
VATKGAAFLAALVLATRYVLPTVLSWAARSQELLALFAVAWAMTVAALSEQLGFSIEVGAFVAGVTVASTPYRDAAGARLVGLRDFLLLFFFLDLGARLEFTDTSTQLVTAAVLSLFVLIGNPLIVMVIMGAMRYPARVSFLAGLTVAQISEFSLILAALGLDLGHIDESTVSLITIVGLVTIGISTYMILNSQELFDRLAPLLRHFERRDHRADIAQGAERFDAIVYGLGRYGTHVVGALRRAGARVLAVDFDPRTVADHRRAGGDVVFGDAEDIDFLEALPLARTPRVVSTIPSIPATTALLNALQHQEYRGQVAVTALDDRDASRYRMLGADVVLRPFTIAANETCELLGVPADSTASTSPKGRQP